MIDIWDQVILWGGGGAVLYIVGLAASLASIH